MDDDLRELARAHGVATWYEDTQRRRIRVADEVVRAVLAELGVDSGAAVRPRPSPLVLRRGECPEIGAAPAELTTEDGAVLPVLGRLPGDLPLGWHRLARSGGETTVVVAPARLEPVRPAWGWQVQLYALHSAGSQGIGDLADLRAFAEGSAAIGAGVVLVNPVQAITPVRPVQRSPYSPSSRRFANPIYLRVPGVEAIRQTGLIDYDAVWTAKLAGLERLWAGQVALAELDEDLRDFATFCALAERHGPDWRDWPPALRHPGNPEVAAARAGLADRVAFHAWLQRLCAEQLAGAHDAARAAEVTLVHDLPVGVDPAGADAWALQDVLASAVRVGAPPDPFSQSGQDWNLPPWRPDRLAAHDYRPFADVIRAVLAHADGIRIDHVAGLWRLWWIPPGFPPSQGTYVHYDAEALLGILALEAHRAGAVVVGEDLGTVAAEVTTTLHERGMLSSAVLYFQRDRETCLQGRASDAVAPGEPPLLPPGKWPSAAMASISTHDLPTAAGYLAAEHVRVRAELGQLDDPAAEFERAAAERAELLEALATHGLLPADPTDEDLVAAMHALLATASSALLLTSPQDALGELRQPNLPGTIDEYPNWRIPLPLPVGELLAHPRLRRAVATLSQARPRVLR